MCSVHFSMDSARRNRRLIGILAATLLIGAGGITAAFGQTSNPAVFLDPSKELVNQQYVDVRVTGEKPNWIVRVRECPAAATTVSQCKQDSQNLNEAGDQRGIATGPDGSGSTPFVVASGDLHDAKGGIFTCNRDSACNVVAFELNDNGFELGFS